MNVFKQLSRRKNESDNAPSSDPTPTSVSDPQVQIKTITFSDGTTVKLEKGDVVVVIGPNNAGKSETLRAVRDKLASESMSPVVAQIQFEKYGTSDDVLRWLSSFAMKDHKSSVDGNYSVFGTNVHSQLLPLSWNQSGARLQGLRRVFCHMLTADARLEAANPAPNIAVLRDAAAVPMQFLIRDDRLELSLSKQFRNAFGADLILNRNAGNEVLLHVGERPIPEAGKDRLSVEYVSALERIPQLHEQGDGMRAFAGILLHASVGRESILLIDEPEAFLHPPQARQLGQMLTTTTSDKRQVIIATHSGDVLRGILDGDKSNVRVVRVKREGDINYVRQLDNQKVKELWNDPLLRYSNILDGVFHERVILCESDADAKFFAAMLDAVTEHSGSEKRKPDMMFAHCGGKDRMPTVLRALREVDVPVVVVADFDVLSAEQPLRAIYETTGGDWSEVERDWKEVKGSIDSKKPELGTMEVKNQIDAVLSGVSGDVFPRDAKNSIATILRRSSPWSLAKTVGKSFVPAGSPTVALGRLLEKLTSHGIRVVEIGELECFDRSVGNHGPKWVNEVLKKHLATAPELHDAREFVRKLLDH